MDRAGHETLFGLVFRFLCQSDQVRQETGWWTPVESCADLSMVDHSSLLVFPAVGQNEAVSLPAATQSTHRKSRGLSTDRDTAEFGGWSWVGRCRILETSDPPPIDVEEGPATVFVASDNRARLVADDQVRNRCIECIE